ncbi:hypothetical protein SBY92_001136 [Candida maltosa Xu316]|uniref:Allantoate permease n=1 Tax=Candida maltosa (strain Xu316) TaxID=1245528 RepID=M3HR08_CANMX|nr:Allantoate permease [Candida maltosa Xu316]
MESPVKSHNSDLEKKGKIGAVTSVSLPTDHLEGFELYEKAQEISEEEEKEIHKRVLRKVDLRIVPLLCITYTLQFLDKLSLNYASAYTFKEDLGLYGQRYSYVAMIFNIAYLVSSFPANYLVQRLPIGKFTSFMIFSWSIILIGHVGLTNYGGALVIRFILGMFEAAISPSCMAICATFYTVKDQPLRMCIFLSFNGVATMVGSLLSFGLGHATNTSLKEWKLIYLVIGLINFVWCFVFFYFCPDTIEKAKFLNEEEKAVLIKEVAKNNQGLGNIHFKKDQVLEALQDGFVWMVALIGLGCGIINGGSSNFWSSLVKGFGFTGIQTTILQLPLGAIELVVVLAAGVIVFKVKNTRCLMMFLICIPPLAGLIGIHVISLQHRWALVGCSFLQYIIGGPVILCWILLNANISGSSKKTIANGIWFSMYATGNIIAPTVFYAYQAPKYKSGMIGLITSYCGIMFFAVCVGVLLAMRNKRRDKEQGQMDEQAAEQALINGFNDMTDFKNRGFRYSY